MRRSLFLIFGLILLAGLVLFWHRGKNLPEPEAFSGEPFRASIITDIDHCPSRNPVNSEHFQRFLDTTKLFQPDLIVSLGDNASHRLSDCSATGDADARYIADTLRNIGFPAYFVLGDHDIASSVASYQAWLETVGRGETYYSFDVKDVHVIILDTVLGGEPLSLPCEEKESCRLMEERTNALKNLSFSEYQKKFPESLPEAEREKKRLKEVLEKEEEEIFLTRSSATRDKGRLSENELVWLEEDLKQTDKKKILVLSDHPLFPFASPKKTYDIENGEVARNLLEKKEKDGAMVVALSGEAHLWHEEVRNGIQYYIVDEFRKASGSWAHITWPQEGFRFEKVMHE